MFPSPPHRDPRPQTPTSGSARYEKTVPAAPRPEASGQPWRVIGHTVRGASHVRRDLENQDAIKWKPEGGGSRVVISVADGHGSPKNFRSAAGAKIAVEVSLGLASELLAIPSDELTLSFVKDRLEQDVPRRIVRDWLDGVDRHLNHYPFREDELVRLEEQDGRKGVELIESNGRLAYGSTLVTAIAMESFMVFWQIGDGDVLTVSASGKVNRPVPGDERLIANETTSLCSLDASRLFRVAVLGTPAPMVMVSTDGFSNSFQDDEGFFKFGSDVREIILAEGLGTVNDRLDGWLREMTERGSGDDISIGIICRPEALLPRLPQPQPEGPASRPESLETQPYRPVPPPDRPVSPPRPPDEPFSAADEGAAADAPATIVLSHPVPDDVGEPAPDDNRTGRFRLWLWRRESRAAGTGDSGESGDQRA